MEICSDDDDQFQVMEQDDNKGQIQNKNNQKYVEIKQSTIKSQPKIVSQNIYSLQIIQNKLDTNLVENQYYQIKLLNNGKIIKQNIIRRFSDFDFLFEILFKNNLGYVFPAFPEKGILSYVKTKVSVTKDEIYSKNRIRMIQRFFKFILNQPQFNYTKCTQIKKFLSNEEFDMFKKIERQKSNGIVNNSWNKLKSYFTFSKQNKYHSITEEIKNQKKRFETLYSKIKQIHNLIEQEISTNQKVCELKYQFSNFVNFKKLVSSYLKDLRELLSRVQALDFQVFCQNQDFIMVFKTIQALQQERNSEQNYKNLSVKQNEFNTQRDYLRQRKEKQYRHQQKKYFELINEMAKIQQFQI